MNVCGRNFITPSKQLDPMSAKTKGYITSKKDCNLYDWLRWPSFKEKKRIYENNKYVKDLNPLFSLKKLLLERIRSENKIEYSWRANQNFTLIFKEKKMCDRLLGKLSEGPAGKKSGRWWNCIDKFKRKVSRYSESHWMDTWIARKKAINAMGLLDQGVSEI